jgi:hypothetical protein
MMRTPLITFLLGATLVSNAQHGTLAIKAERPLSVPPSAQSAPLLYPNPSNHTLYVLWGDGSLERMPIEVRTLEGRLTQLDVLSAENALDVSRLEEGTYRLLLMDLSGIRAQAVFTVRR